MVTLSLTGPQTMPMFRNLWSPNQVRIASCVGRVCWYGSQGMIGRFCLKATGITHRPSSRYSSAEERTLDLLYSIVVCIVHFRPCARRTFRVPCAVLRQKLTAPISNPSLISLTDATGKSSARLLEGSPEVKASHLLPCAVDVARSATLRRSRSS